jgi:ABC-2 type transport system permease protein
VEIILLSVDSRQLMIGKLLGLSTVALLQLAIWLGIGSLVMDRGASMFDLSGFDFPPSFVIWAVLFLLLGFFLYGSIMMAGGALAPTAREGGQITLLLVLPFMPTLIFASEFLENPHGTLSTALSFIPLTAPSAMVTRMAVADVPLWQPIVAAVGVGLTAYFFVVLAARFFRPQNLLQFGAFSWRRLWTAWR